MKIAVITGASSGLGREYALAADKMYDVDELWLVARRLDRLEALAKELTHKARAVALDITDPSCIEEYSRLLTDNSADVRLLINNAGFGKLGRFDELPLSQNTGMVRLNCEAFTAVAAATLPFMNRGAQIVSTCSIAAFAPNTRMAVYSSTKAFVLSLSKALRSELKNRGINCLAVCPGPMDTEFLAVADIPKGASHTFDTLPRVNPARMARRSLAASQKGRAVYTDLIFYKFYRLIAKILPQNLVMKLCGA